MKDTALEFIKDNLFIILGGLCIIVVGIIYVASRSGGGNMELGEPIALRQEAATETITEAITEAIPETTTPPATYIIHIVGEVHNPGVFQVASGARVTDVVDLAGGATPDANLAGINLAAPVRDGVQIIVPAIGEDIPISHDMAMASGNSSGLVNINTATATELQTLPGIGTAIASNIIEHRENNGGFSTIDELINVPRIGAITLDRLRDLVTV